MARNKQAISPTPSEDLPPITSYVQEEATSKPNAIIAAAELVQGAERIIRFRGRGMILLTEPFPHFTPLHKEQFDPIAYRLLGGLSRSKVADIFAYVISTAEDLTQFDRYIGFGMDPSLATTPQVWDTRLLKFTNLISPEQTVWRSPYPAVPPSADGPGSATILFLTGLAGGDGGVYGDIVQSLAPIIMERKPDGALWWVGDGANGKSTLMDAIYRIFPGQLSSINVKRLTDGRDTVGLNGTLANVVKESSEGRIEDTEIYKSLGTHEDFPVHKFHSQESVTVLGNIHHIFSANSIPTLNDKGFSARRRTFIVPFTQRFESDPEFEKKTFTEHLMSGLVAEMMRYAVALRDQGYQYKWSAQASSAKLDYDADANSAEEFGRELVESGIVGFSNFSYVKMEYENWCSDNGYVPLGVNNLRRAMKAVQFERRSIHTEGFSPIKRYLLKNVESNDIVEAGMARPGMFTKPGWRSHAPQLATELNPEPNGPQQQPLDLPDEEDESRHQAGRKPRESW